MVNIKGPLGPRNTVVVFFFFAQGHRLSDRVKAKILKDISSTGCISAT